MRMMAARPQTEAQRSKVRLGKGLIWSRTDDGVPVYARPLGVAEVQSLTSEID